MRIISWLKTLVAVVVLVVAASYLLYSSDWFQKKFIYPFPYREIVFKYAEANDVDPFLVAAVIRTESKFIPQAKSAKGAIGLMQMMPDTGQWVANQTDYENFTATSLNDPDVSIRFGTWYLASLKKEFKNNDVLMLAAYNGGRGNVKQWMSQYDWTVSFKDIDQIPFRETRDYVKKVQLARQRYRDLYGR